MLAPSSKPEAYIASKKNRLKIYGGSQVYLNDKQEFEIELFNPMNITIGVKFEINDMVISNNLLVLRPGMRYYLDRYINEAKKLTFQTYEVPRDDKAMAAIAKNGLVKISFFKEYFPSTSMGTYNFGWTGSGTNNFGWQTPTTFVSYPVFYDATISSSTLNASTGRVEMGSASNQSFENYFGSFEAGSFYTVQYKILPASAKPIEAKSIRNYCPNCRTRIKSSTWKFCTNCGSRL
jgi:hypothetical protein